MPPAHIIVWVCMAVAIVGTLYFMMHEPEEGVPTTLSPPMHQARRVAFPAACLGAVVGTWYVLWGGGRENLFAMAVLFNIILTCFWLLRFFVAV